MKNIKRVIIALLAIVAISTTANAQLRWGIKAGVGLDKINYTTVSDAAGDIAHNNTGFQVGLMTEFTVPLVGVGFDAALMYNRRNFKMGENDKNRNANFLDIPVHLKYKFSIPAVGNLLAPYLFVGPDFAFNLSAKDATEAYKEKKFDCFLDLGAGIQLINHLQIGVGYSWGLNKVMKVLPLAGNTAAGTAKINGWTISAAYLF